MATVGKPSANLQSRCRYPPRFRQMPGAPLYNSGISPTSPTRSSRPRASPSPLLALGRRRGPRPVHRRAGSLPSGRNAIRCAGAPPPQFRKKLPDIPANACGRAPVRVTYFQPAPEKFHRMRLWAVGRRAIHSISVTLRYFGNLRLPLPCERFYQPRNIRLRRIPDMHNKSRPAHTHVGLAQLLCAFGECILPFVEFLGL